MNIHPKIASFFATLWELIFLGAVAYGTVSLFLITSMTHGQYATIGNPTWDPMLRLAGAYAPFLFWAVYIFAHKGWIKRMFAFAVLLAATFMLLLALPHFQHHHVPPAQTMPGTG